MKNFYENFNFKCEFNVNIVQKDGTFKTKQIFSNLFNHPCDALVRCIDTFEKLLKALGRMQQCATDATFTDPHGRISWKGNYTQFGTLFAYKDNKDNCDFHENGIPKTINCTVIAQDRLNFTRAYTIKFVPVPA